MKLRIVETFLDEIVIIQPECFGDARGFFMETYREDQFAELGLPTKYVQDNHSGSCAGVVRGLHFQYDPPMGKLMRVTHGSAFLVAVDIRKNSPTLGRWWGAEISAENKKMVWAPAGFARGMCPLSDWVDVQYKCTGIYSKDGECAIRWDDPDIGLKWPIENPTISDRDRQALSLRQWLETPAAERFAYEPPRVAAGIR